MVMTVAKLTKRKHSVFVAQAFKEAFQPLSHLTPEQLSQAVAEHKARQERMPEHIKIIRQQGVMGVLNGHTDAQIARYIEATEIADREVSTPGDFVSERTGSAVQSAHATGPRKRSNPDYEDICDYVLPKMRRGEQQKAIIDDAVAHFDSNKFSARKITRAIAWGRENKIIPLTLSG